LPLLLLLLYRYVLLPGLLRMLQPLLLHPSGLLLLLLRPRLTLLDKLLLLLLRLRSLLLLLLQSLLGGHLLLQGNRSPGRTREQAAGRTRTRLLRGIHGRRWRS
jgi:hypothetical protein